MLIGSANLGNLGTIRNNNSLVCTVDRFHENLEYINFVFKNMNLALLILRFDD